MNHGCWNPSTGEFDLSPEAEEIFGDLGAGRSIVSWAFEFCFRRADGVRKRLK
jgi:hypothetical protein